MPKNAYAWLSSRDSVEEKEREGERWRVAHQVTWSRKRTQLLQFGSISGFEPNEEGRGGKYGRGNLQIVQQKGDARWEMEIPRT